MRDKKATNENSEQRKRFELTVRNLEAAGELDRIEAEKRLETMFKPSIKRYSGQS